MSTYKTWKSATYSAACQHCACVTKYDTFKTVNTNSVHNSILPMGHSIHGRWEPDACATSFIQLTAFTWDVLIQIAKIAVEQNTSRCPFYCCYFFISSLILYFILQYWMGNSSSSMNTPAVVNATAKHTASVRCHVVVVCRLCNPSM